MSPVGSLAGQARQRLGGSRRDRNLEPRRAMIAQVVYLSPAAGSPASTQTALITPVPAADPMVGQVRERFDVAAGWGVPAHITVIYPFVSPDEVSEELISDLQRIISPVSAFTCHFERTRWFGDDVVWLDPNPTQPFCDLTNTVWDAFPQHPPYAGAHPQIVPHLTIAEARHH